MGEFSTDNFYGEGGDYLVWFLFVSTTFITQITFLSMLIAIMGDTFDKTTEVKEQSALKEKIDILADYVAIVGRESIKKENRFRFIFAVTPAATS